MTNHSDFITASHHQSPLRYWISAGIEGIYTGEGEPAALTNKALRQAIMTAPLKVTYLARHPDKPILYAVLRGENSSQIHAYHIQPDSRLIQLSCLTDCPAGAAHLSINRKGTHLAVAYYISGKAGIYPLGPDGTLSGMSHEVAHTGSSIHPQRQKSPHPHWTGFSRDSTLLYITDLGLDQIRVYQITRDNSLTLWQNVSAPSGSGPRHMAFHPTFNQAYVTGELSAVISCYRCDPTTGKLTSSHTVDSFPRQSRHPRLNVSDLKIHPSGRFLYVLNREVARISVFSIHPETGALRYAGQEPTWSTSSRSLTFDPDGDWLFVTGESSHSVELFRVNQTHGQLTGYPPVLSVPNPMSIITETTSE